MSKTRVLVTKINGYILISFGLMYIGAIGLYASLIPFSRTFSDATPPDVKHVIITHMVLTSLLGMLFVISFIASGIGVLRFKDWARKLSRVILVLNLFILIPVGPVEIEIGPARIVYILISIAIICLLSKRYVKDLFNKKDITHHNSL